MNQPTDTEQSVGSHANDNERARSDWETGGLPGDLGSPLPWDPAWCLVVGSTEDMLAVDESVLCLADGRIGTRAVLEERPGVHSSGVISAGLYQADGGLGDMLLALPAWYALPLAGKFPPGLRVLDLRDGVMVRTAEANGVALHSARFASARRPGTAVLIADLNIAQVELSGSGAAQPIHDGPGNNRDLRSRLGLHDTQGPFAKSADGLAPDRDPSSLDDVVVQEIRSAIRGGAVSSWATTVVDQEYGRRTPGVTINRVASHLVSSRRHPSSQVARRRLERTMASGPRRLLAEQRSVWESRWSDADIEIVGDLEATLTARFALFHLMSSAAHSGESAIGPRGLTGPAYGGHVMWDTDVFVCPVLCAVDAPAARSVLEYRLRRLDQAKLRARSEGYRGARWPWESAADGSDVTPRSGINQHGEHVSIETGDLEEHITADVAWSAWRYASWSGSWSFLEGPGGNLIVESARYWASRLRIDGTGRAHLNGVIGPDEYHAQVDDNTYTNLMARWNLRRAAELIERSNPDSSAQEEAQNWRQAAETIVDGWDQDTGLYEQFSGYNKLEPIMAGSLGQLPVAADLVLTPEHLARTQVIKQADVLMAFHLIPDELAPGSLPANLAHYLPRTAHGSSLSPSVHACLLAQAGQPDEALEMLQLASAVDLEDLTQTTGSGLHLANLGGIWQTLVHGFGGVKVTRPDEQALRIDPHLPASWPEMRLSFVWHEQRIRLDIRHQSVFVHCDKTLNVDLSGETITIEPPGRCIG